MISFAKFVVAKINVYCYACAVVCRVVSKLENGIIKENGHPFCCQVVMTHVLVHLRKSEREASTGKGAAKTWQIQAL